MTETVPIAGLMEQSGVGFGTSGARGLAQAMTDRVCYAYTAAFLDYLTGRGEVAVGDRVALAGDLRSSSPRIMRACSRAILDRGFVPVNCGFIPTPAVTCWAMGEGLASIMVTGSHIPDDRNGIKFNRPAGEILKEDEAGIRAQAPRVPDLFDAAGALRAPAELPPVSQQARAAYVARYLDFLPAGSLSGRRIAVYEHSSVAREILAEVLAGLGAEVLRLGRSERFIPVDTEAVRPEDEALARGWAREHGFFAICSADGDGDRPLVGDERGEFLRGDVAGILTAGWLEADTVVTPVSSNTAVERCGWFERVERTRIGSPYVIAGMLAAPGEPGGRLRGQRRVSHPLRDRAGRPPPRRAAHARRRHRRAGPAAAGGGAGRPGLRARRPAAPALHGERPPQGLPHGALRRAHPGAARGRRGRGERRSSARTSARLSR